MKTNSLFGLLALGAMAACNDPKGTVERDTLAEATEDSAVVYDDERGRVEADGAEIKDVGEDFWAGINWDAPVVQEPDLSDVEVRSEGEYSIYTMDDRILFDTDKAQIRAEGEEKLQVVADKIKETSPSGQIRIFGHADARAGKAYNKELSAERANAVKEWLQNKGGIAANRISTEAMGESDPRATNETARGRQLNRHVAIVVQRQQ